MTHIVSYGGSITFGPTIDVYGGLKLKDNALCFADGTCQTTALVNDGSAMWGQITGLISNQTDLQNQMNTKEDKANKGVANGYASLDSSGRLPASQLSAVNQLRLTKSTSGTTPVWNTDSSSWNEDTSWYLFPPVSEVQYVVYTKQSETSTLDISLTDNIGTFSNSWCNVGVFVNDSIAPVCSGTWFGISGVMTFNQQVLKCNVSLPAGEYVFKVKHRSKYCAYGNYPSTGDDFGTYRQLLVREVH